MSLAFYYHPTKTARTIELGPSVYWGGTDIDCQRQDDHNPPTKLWNHLKVVRVKTERRGKDGSLGQSLRKSLKAHPFKIEEGAIFEVLQLSSFKIVPDVFTILFISSPWPNGSFCIKLPAPQFWAFFENTGFYLVAWIDETELFENGKIRMSFAVQSKILASSSVQSEESLLSHNLLFLGTFRI